MTGSGPKLKRERKRSRAKRDNHQTRGVAMGYVGNEKRDEELKAALNETAVARAAAKHSEEQRECMSNSRAECVMAMVRMEGHLKETEDLALNALEKYELAAKQRAELYYQAKSSNALAARALMESLGAGSEPCKRPRQR